MVSSMLLSGLRSLDMSNTAEVKFREVVEPSGVTAAAFPSEAFRGEIEAGRHLLRSAISASGDGVVPDSAVCQMNNTAVREQFTGVAEKYSYDFAFVMNLMNGVKEQLRGSFGDDLPKLCVVIMVALGIYHRCFVTPLRLQMQYMSWRFREADADGRWRFGNGAHRRAPNLI